MESERLLPADIAEGESPEALRAQRDFYKHCFETVVESLPDPAGVVDAEGTVVGWNPGLADLVGVPAEAAYGEQAYDLVGTAGEEEVLSERVAKRGETIVEDDPRVGETSDGDRWAVTAKAFPLTHPDDGRTIGAVQVNTDVTGIVERNRDLSETLDRRAELITENCREIEDAVETAEDSVEAVADSFETAAAAGERVEELAGTLEDQAADITQVTETIDDIAEQTNLLALNANIEAARATNGDGTDGHGFEVVAEEVKALAGQSRAEVEEVREHVEAIRAEIDETGDAIEQLQAELDDAVANIESLERTQSEITDRIRRIIEEMTAVTESVETPAVGGT